MKSDIKQYVHDLNGVFTTILTSAELEGKRSGESPGTLDRIQTAARQGGALLEKLGRSAGSDGVSDEVCERDLRYLSRSHPDIDPALAALEKRGLEDTIPIVNRETGRMLGVMASALRAENVLEIGTAYGYSTLWFALAQPESGRIVTIDPDRARTDIARQFWERAGVADRIEVINQPALSALPGLPKNHFDIVFIDALKEEYEQYFKAALPLLKTPGLLLADNLLWHHQAAQPPSADDPATTKSIRRFNELFLHHPQLRATIIPVGDGLGIGAKTE